MNMPCPRVVPCLPEGPGTNYSSEAPDLLDYPKVTNWQEDPPVDASWTADSCVGVCTSVVSQEDADLCAQRAALECVRTSEGQPPPIGNAPQTCTVACPEGGFFSATVAGGLFTAATQALADAQAASYACRLANEKRFCLEPLPQCLCFGVSTCLVLGVSGNAEGALTFAVIAGLLPLGMALVSNSDCGGGSPKQAARVAGVPSVPGAFLCTIAATDASGNRAVRDYEFSVLEITTAALPDFEVGVPYSFQMGVAGGSGSYAWKVAAGALPPGLTMTVGGLISGTPTGGSSGTLTFDVIDLACQEADQSFFPPHVAMTTRSTTQVATVIGYAEMPGFVSTPPKRYKKLSWVGYSEQTAFTWAAGAQAAHARYDYSGASEIDVNGNQLSRYSKLFSQWCPDNTEWPRNIAVPNLGPPILKGYCWNGDPNSCGECSDPPEAAGNAASDSITDASDFLRGAVATTVDSVVFAVDRSGDEAVALLEGPVNFPQATVNGITGSWVIVKASHQYSGLLEDEYTDADALSVAPSYVSGGNTAENSPRTTGFVSRFTAVQFTLLCSNLLAGKSYQAAVVFYNTVTGARTVRTYAFTATDVTETIIDSVPAPPVGQPVQVRAPSIIFA